MPHLLSPRDIWIAVNPSSPCPPQLKRQPNPALLYLRYFPSIDRSVDQAWYSTGALEWYACLAAVDRRLFEALRLRRQLVAESLGGMPLCLRTLGRLAVGLGNPSRKENSGTSFARPYGFPLLPGSSLKGLLRHFLEEELADAKALTDALSSMGAADLQGAAALDGKSGAEVASTVLGRSGEHGSAGLVSFLDGWPLEPGGWFGIDVVTCHHQGYYGDGSRNPGDDEGPIPAHVLVIEPDVDFDVWFLPSPSLAVGDEVKQAATLKCVRHLLSLALRTWGLGAKTGSGYGRMVERTIAEETAT